MRRLDPHVGLVAAALVTVTSEAATRSYVRYGVEATVTGAALLLAWRAQDRLRPAFVGVLALALPLALAIVHGVVGIDGDVDVQQIYPDAGAMLLDGQYPRSEYPPGAVVLFALEAATGSVRAANAVAMALAHAVIVLALAGFKTRTAVWLAAAVAVWPLDAFFWEFKFDLVPTALLVAGLLAAHRDRWFAAGALLGFGTIVKWTPFFAAVVLGAWLLSSRRSRSLVRLAAGLTLSMVAVLPFLAWDANAVAAAVTRQAPRGITGESFWYLPLRLVGWERRPGGVYDSVGAPEWVNLLAVATQLGAIAALVAAAVALRTRQPPAIAVAALAPATFLLLNRIFSAQFILPVVASWTVAAALLLTRRGQLVVGTAAAVASSANVLVYPIGRGWQIASAVFFAVACALTAALAVRAFGERRTRHECSRMP